MRKTFPGVLARPRKFEHIIKYFEAIECIKINGIEISAHICGQTYISNIDFEIEGVT